MGKKDKKQNGSEGRLSTKSLRELRDAFRKAIEAHSKERVIAEIGKLHLAFLSGSKGHLTPDIILTALTPPTVSDQLQYNDVGRIRNALDSLNGPRVKNNKYAKHSKVGSGSELAPDLIQQ